LEKERKDGTVLPVDETDDFEVVRHKEIVRLEVWMPDGWPKKRRRFWYQMRSYLQVEFKIFDVFIR
jgi:hypothetical protein